MLELNVNPRSVAAITSALNKIKEMVVSGAVEKSALIHITLEPGIYQETIRYNLSNPLLMECLKKPEDCVITADNCETFKSGSDFRSIVSFGANVTKVTLKNLTIKNTHVKTIPLQENKGDSAEALSWNTNHGNLICKNCILESKKNTLTVKGNACFIGCKIIGDQDIISGEAEKVYFEDCTVNVLEDNRGEFNASAICSQSLANTPGFIFKDCLFIAEKRKKSNVYLCRTMGKGSATSKINWDNITFLNCKIQDSFAEDFVFDDDMNLTVYPRATATSGIREYNTKRVNKNFEFCEDNFRRNVRQYLLNYSDYYENYASRYIILKAVI